MATLALFAALVGCRDDATEIEVEYVDRWTPTAAECGWDRVVPTYDDLRVEMGDATYPSSACVDRILSDLSVDVDSFQGDEPSSNAYAVVEGVTEWTKIVSVLDVARGFFLADMGLVQDVGANALISTEFELTLEEVSAQTGLEEVNASLYSFVTSVVEKTVPGDSTFFDPSSRTLSIGPDGMVGLKGTAVLVHESRHLWSRHTKCGEYNCDADISGAYGYHLSALLQVWKNIALEGPGEYTIQLDLEDEIKYELMARRIEAFQSEPGVLLDQWEGADLAEY